MTHAAIHDEAPGVSGVVRLQSDGVWHRCFGGDRTTLPEVAEESREMGLELVRLIHVAISLHEQVAVVGKPGGGVIAVGASLADAPRHAAFITVTAPRTSPP